MRRSAEEIGTLVRQDLERHGLSENSADAGPHRIDLGRRLVPPRAEIVIDSFNDGVQIKVWVVLETKPQGYSIVYDDADGFGLVTPGPKGPVLIGFYGSFVDALKAM